MTRINKGKMLSVIICVLLISVSCSHKETISSKILSITQGNLFKGELKELGPHLQFLGTTSVSIDYKGDKKKLSCSYEIWSDGELLEKNGICTKILSEDGFDGEVSISLKDLINNDLERSDYLMMTVVISEENGHVRSTKFINRYDKNLSSGPISLQDNIETNNDSEQIPIWTYIADDGDFYVEKHDMDEVAVNHKWTLLIKIKFSN
ncbi:hypothetical protein PV797_10235 [Clostridiaceae bacterium M8S5]|nr:hypothetical protein PV797_10235 [Clostridiaceae bacterium M8S5]